jgi:predicted adenylyl cyclase CyaB
MPHINIEIKAWCSEPDKIRAILLERNADFKGIDQQIDSYFKVPKGRLKLREGDIENSLIFYNRSNKIGPKQAEVYLYNPESNTELKEILVNALGILVTVKKKREIYLIDNVKFHIDAVDNLGAFIEIEAIDTTGEIGTNKLLEQCQRYMSIFDISKEELIDCSYSDMLIRKGRNSSIGD